MKTVPESVEYRDALTAKRTWYRKQCVPIRNVKGTFIYLPLQLNSDTQITLFSPHFKDMGIFIEHTCTLFHEHQILVKCHPKDTPSNITRYEEICGRFSNVIFVNDKNNISYCAQAKAVIAINSTAINEALMFHKPVMAFGYNIFSNKGIVYEVNDIGDIKYQRGFLKFKPNGNLVDRYLRYLLSRQITVTSPEIEKVIPLFTTQSEVPINLLPSVEPSSASRPIINLVMHGPCEWAFESFANHIITHLASRHNIIISEYPIEGASVYQYFRPQIPKAINNLQSLSSRHPFYSRGIHMLHDSPADLQRHNTTWRKANIDKFAKILCLSQEQHNHYSKFIPASKLVYASPGPLKQETFPVITEHNQCGKLRLGFTSRIYPDGVKGVDLYLGIAMLLDPTKFEFVVKSPNAQRLVPILQRGGHTVHTSGNIDILLVTSRFEGLPSTLLEAVASGVYTLSTKVGVAPEILPSDMILPTSPKLWAEHLNGVYNQRNKLKTFIDDSKHLLNFHNWDVYCAILERTWRDIMISNQS